MHSWSLPEYYVVWETPAGRQRVTGPYPVYPYGWSVHHGDWWRRRFVLRVFPKHTSEG